MTVRDGDGGGGRGGWLEHQTSVCRSTWGVYERKSHRGFSPWSKHGGRWWDEEGRGDGTQCCAVVARMHHSKEVLSRKGANRKKRRLVVASFSCVCPFVGTAAAVKKVTRSLALIFHCIFFGVAATNPFTQVFDLVSRAPPLFSFRAIPLCGHPWGWRESGGGGGITVPSTPCSHSNRQLRHRYQ